MNVLRKLLLMGALMMSGTASAHHSFLMFDLDKEVILQGVVKEFQWTNPHVWLQVMVPDGKGTSTEWSLEMSAPGILLRSGWTRSMLKPNDQVTVLINPLKTGAPSGRLLQVTLPDGRVMGGGGPALRPATRR
jgi:hypothetical protein